MAKRWSEAELAIAAQIKQSAVTVKEMAHLLPGRTIHAIKRHVSVSTEGVKQRGKTSWVWQAIIRELTACPSQTIGELSDRIGCCYRQVYDQLLENHGSNVFVSDWARIGSNHREKWSLGNQIDAPKPPKRSREEKRRLERERYRFHKAKKTPFNVLLMQVGVAKLPTLTCATGRVYQQSMKLSDFDEELEAAA